MKLTHEGVFRNLRCFEDWKLISIGCLFCLLIGFVAPAFAVGPYEDQGNGAVLDKGSGLMWQKGDSHHELKKALNWYDALEYLGQKNAEKLAGYSDWRLPTRAELEGLWDAARTNRSKDNEALGLAKEFEEGGSYYLWTRDERGLDFAWYFGLGHKELYFNLKDLSDLGQGAKLVRQAGK
ncbi:MAG: DUF1566 domain-containing protein [Candidatus Nitrohelix vancouverensis]|uniref:DUF1566 domain-containing protein n=1 Tax=Candidatus Nitrohelix vancouverensis TaxID=2705534 RepID=A0A7T0G2I4_9BACT|nr:MAG: DUF1566 domain-containing protein [Candidatus Nitrohelix vancouverensis]